MIASVLALLAFDLVFLVALIWLTVAAFRVNWGWGLVQFLPFGSLIFACKHWPKARTPFLTMVVCGAVMGAIIGAQPDLLARIKAAREAARQQRAFGTVAAPGSAAPHETRDLAESEAPIPAVQVRPAADPNATLRAACAKQFAELTATYQQLNAERAALKPGQATADFNAKAVRYQQSVQALTAEKAQLDALDHPGLRAPPAADPPDAAGAATLDRLQLLANAGDYLAFGELMKTCLAGSRQSAVFPRMVTLARRTLPNATPDKLSALIQRQTDAARAETETVTRQIQAIVNQTPPSVPKPPGGPEIYGYDFHPGATKPNFNTADLLSTRELWKGDYVYIQHVPGVYYRSADCEFNAQTKYFITNRDVPKKKLTDAEYRQLTALYRALGRDETIIASQAQRLADVGRASGELLALNTQLGK
jgi:hypothetical protein